MRRHWWIVTLLLRNWCILVCGHPLVPGRSAATLWDRRDRNMSTMFHDYRARNIGDVLTVFIEETTGFDAQEKREMDKKTTSDMNFGGTGSTSGLAAVLSKFGLRSNSTWSPPRERSPAITTAASTANSPIACRLSSSTSCLTATWSLRGPGSG